MEDLIKDLLLLLLTLIHSQDSYLPSDGRLLEKIYLEDIFQTQEVASIYQDPS